MSIEVLRHKSAAQVRRDVNGFAPRYTRDWDDWIAATDDARPELFGKILRKWPECRPHRTRRLRNEAEHEAPFLDDLLKRAVSPIGALGSLTVITIAGRSREQEIALNSLWAIFSELPTSGDASCVGITKAILLLTDGRTGPAFDSKVRKQLHVPKPINCGQWLKILEKVAEDIAEFERECGQLTRAVPARFARLEYGRLYDMALGPR